MPKYINDSIKRLFQAIPLLENEKECEAFFDDLCTINELQNMAQRLETAVMIAKGISYQEISKKTGASTTTISRVSRCYNYGDEGYKNIIRRLQQKGLIDEDL
ncbi:MAG: helix-turn-helix domain-containing protein [Erysipelotrichaceae bacterium]|nr:helix-turn-helix domain-containing protein [Erysipelotrichaceae bacterium]